MFKKLIDKIDNSQRTDDSRRSLRNAAYNLADCLLLPVLWLISTPIFVSRLGTDRFGIWMLVNAVMGLSGVMAFGLTDATIKYVSKYRALSDEAGVVRVVRSTLTMYGLLGVLTAVIVFFIAPFLVNNVFNVEPQNTALAISALQIGGMGVAVRFFDSVFLSAIYGYERYDLAARVTMVTNSLTIGINVVLVLIGYGLIGVLINTFGWIVAGGCCKVWVVKNMLIRGLPLRPVLDRETLREIFSFGIYSWVQGIGGILFGQVDRLLVAFLLSTTALAYYTICLQLAQQIHSLLARTTSFVFPLSSAIKETGNSDRLRRLYFKGLNYTTIAATAIGLPLFMCSHGVLSLWIGQPFADNASSILRVLVFVMCILATSIVPYYYLNGTGFVRLNTLFALISGTIVTIAGFLLIPWLGAIGAAWARTANTPTSIIARTILHYKVLSDRRWYAGMFILLPVVISFCVGFGLLQLFGEPSASIFLIGFLILSYTLLGAFLSTGTCLLIRKTPKPAID
jgi:O-antigen/teichoic acid export membrane protein